VAARHRSCLQSARLSSRVVWGAFSVIDHKNEIRLATELLLYDKIAVPTPTDRHGPDWNRWEDEGWQPEKLMNIVDRLKPARLVQEVEWNANREQSWRKKFEDAKAAIERVNADIQHQIDMRVADIKRHPAGRSKEELDQAIRDAAFAGTRSELIAHLRGQYDDKRVDIWNGRLSSTRPTSRRQTSSGYIPTTRSRSSH
jgi:hypothetical protein